MVGARVTGGTELNSVPNHVAANLHEAVEWVLKDIRSAGVYPPQH